MTMHSPHYREHPFHGYPPKPTPAFVPHQAAAETPEQEELRETIPAMFSSLKVKEEPRYSEPEKDKPGPYALLAFASERCIDVVSNFIDRSRNGEKRLSAL
jgi:hypothetical protein